MGGTVETVGDTALNLARVVLVLDQYLVAMHVNHLVASAELRGSDGHVSNKQDGTWTR